MADSAAAVTAQRWRAITLGEPVLITTIIAYYNDAMSELDLRKYVTEMVYVQTIISTGPICYTSWIPSHDGIKFT